jgi:hypothetical protein
MGVVDDIDQLNEQYHLASGEFLKGNPEPVKNLWSHREDVSLANPYGPPVRGWDVVAKTIEHASSLRSDGLSRSFGEAKQIERRHVVRGLEKAVAAASK